LYILTGSPFTGKMQEKLQLFLTACQLEYDLSVEFSVAVMEEAEIIATASLSGDTVRCVAVHPAHQGEDLTARVLTPLIQHAAQQGKKHLLLYTKPHNQHLFAALGFHAVIRTSDCLLMENKRNGLEDFLTSLERPDNAQGAIGCIVANCNPFTFGHRYLIETAAAQCAYVHVFVLSENRGLFSPEERLHMVKVGCADLKNVFVHPTGPYMVSSATFPSYFIKDKKRTGDIQCELDVQLFAERIAPTLHITHRFVGSEPDCAVTARYNQTLLQLLPGYGIKAVEIPRKAVNGRYVSASYVRSLIKNKCWEQLSDLLPPSTLELLYAIKGDVTCRIHSACSEA